jgi:copper chaperone NosL
MNTHTRRALLLGAGGAAVTLTGCGGGPADATVPPRISLGRDTCDTCGMIISDERYAAGLVAPDGATTIYDDVGEMLRVVAEEGLRERRAWVHDWNSVEWIDATTAVFIRAAPETTPMGTGLIAFAKHEDATAFADGGEADILTWDDAVRTAA